MSDYVEVRVTIEVAIWDKALANEIVREAKGPLQNQSLGPVLTRAIKAGRAEIDTLSNAEKEDD